MNRRALLTATPIVLVGATRAGADEPRRGRTYYDRLALDTPDEAAATFVSAYSADDYATVWMVLAIETQRAIETAIDTFDFERLLAVRATGLKDILSSAVPAPDRWEQDDTGWLFDRLMVVGAAHGVLPIEIGPGATVRPAGGDPPSVAVVDRSDTTTLRLSRSAAGRWRVLSAIPAGRDPGSPPWGLPTAG